MPDDDATGADNRRRRRSWRGNLAQHLNLMPGPLALRLMVHEMPLRYETEGRPNLQIVRKEYLEHFDAEQEARA